MAFPAWPRRRTHSRARYRLPHPSVPPKLGGVTLLLVLTAVLLLASGLVKLHAGDRAGLGLTVLPLVETVAGLALLAPVMLGRRPSAHGGLAIVVCGVALVLVSSLLVGSAIVRKRRSREDSEGARLVTYVKYLSRQRPPET